MINCLIIITGSSGFIGKHISEKLLQNGQYVTGIDIMIKHLRT